MPSPHRSELQSKRRRGRSFGPNQLVYSHCCDHCGKVFYASRPDAKYDTPKCRAAAARKRLRDRARQRHEQWKREYDERRAAEDLATPKTEKK